MSWPTYSTARDPLLRDVLVSEVDSKITRKQRTVLAGSGSDRKLKIGTVAAFSGSLTISSTANQSNAGNGTVSAAATLKPNAQVGDYSVEFTGATTFAVFDPKGSRLADGTTGAAYDNGQIGFTITAGGTAFEAGDGFAISVEQADGKLVAYDPSAVDGAGRDPVIIAENVTAFDGSDAMTVTLERLCTIKSSGLIWPAGITDAQKSAALASLEARHVVALTNA